MAQLHLIAQRLTPDQFAHSLERFVAEKDSLLFIADAVTCLVDKDFSSTFDSLNLPSYGLESDLKCRGFNQQVSDSIQIIDDAAMVQLTLEHDKTISW